MWFGYIVGAYGLVGLIFTAGFLNRKNKTLLVWANVLTGILILATVFAVIGSVFAAARPGRQLPGRHQGHQRHRELAGEHPARLSEWATLLLFQGVLTLVIPIAVLIAFWAARQRVLEEPDRHRRLLVTTAVVGITLGWGGGAVHALEHIGVLPVPDHVSWVFFATQPLTGLFGGLGYVALFGLIAAALARRGPTVGPLTTAVTAVGKRSLSSYLAQSVIFAPLLCAGAWALVLSSAAPAWPLWRSPSGWPRS